MERVTRPSSDDTRSENRRARAERRKVISRSGKPGRTGMKPLAKGCQNSQMGPYRNHATKPLTVAKACGKRSRPSKPEPCDKGKTMPKQEWGTKRICPTTGKRFYDLNRVPVVSPYTGEVVDIESARRKMAAAVISRAVPEKDDDVLVDDLEADDELLAAATPDGELDDELLEDDADDNVSLDELADVAGDEEEH
jgi:uncharacterized protein (TIGR02300 family)